MSYESSYDTNGGVPFKPNKDRGFWSSSNDFVFACICNAFRMDVIFGIAVVPIIAKGGVYMLVALLLNIALFAVPIVYMQSFLGQFSSSGFISAFRIAPLFKGLGYIAVAMNMVSLAFYGVFAGIPILFFIHSLQPTLPWSCDVWSKKNSSFYQSHCNINETEIDEFSFHVLQIPSLEYFAEIMGGDFHFPLFGCVVLIWVVVAIALCSTTEKIGKIFRYCSITLFVLLSIIFFRMIYLSGATEGLHKHFTDQQDKGFQWEMCLFVAPMLTLANFGPGWGTVLSMASYNTFKTNINKFSWIICLSQFGVMLMLGLICMFTESHLTSNNQHLLSMQFDRQWSSFLSIPSSLATMEFAHLWNWIYFIVLIIGSFNLMLIQTFSVLTALLDEFEYLRYYKIEVIFGITAVLALSSAFFCSEDGTYFIELITDLSISSQAFMNLMLLIIVVWVYGRERYQRDAEFMTSQVLPTWKVYSQRFVTPIFLIITLMIGCLLALLSPFSVLPHLIPIGFVLTVLPWLALPVYCAFKLLQTNGSLGTRFKRCVKPTDWYPVDSEDRDRYEETIENPESLQPLTTIVL